MELQWPLILFTTLTAGGCGVLGGAGALALKGAGKKSQQLLAILSCVLLAVGGIAFPVYSERLRLSEAVGGEADAQGALIAKETFGAFASAVAAAQTLRSTTRFSTILSLLSGILGLCLCALLLYWGSAAAVSPFHIAAFQLIWALVAGFLSGILQRL